jgi:hypothetical protein
MRYDWVEWAVEGRLVFVQDLAGRWIRVPMVISPRKVAELEKTDAA